LPCRLPRAWCWSAGTRVEKADYLKKQSIIVSRSMERFAGQVKEAEGQRTFPGQQEDMVGTSSSRGGHRTDGVRKPA
jgi:hypothetical protein